MVAIQGDLEIQGVVLDQPKKAGACGIFSLLVLVLTGQVGVSLSHLSVVSSFSYSVDVLKLSYMWCLLVC